MKTKLSQFLAVATLVCTSTIAVQAATPEVNLYGHLVGSPTSNGICQFTTGATSTVTLKSEIAAFPSAGAVKVDNRYYTFIVDEQGSYGKEYRMNIYDADNGFLLVSPATVTAEMATKGQILAYDESTKTVFCSYQDQYNASHLATLDLSHRTRKVLGTLDTKMLTLSFDSQGKLYGISNVGSLYEIDKTNGQLTYKGSTGVSPLEYVQAATFVAGDDNTLYWAACMEPKGSLYAVNVANGKATLIREFPNDEEFVSLWAGAVVVVAGAPAAATDLKATFEGGATTGKFSFKAPTTTHDGSPLSGTLNYVVKIDGKQATNGTVEAGATATSDVTTTQGQHEFTVVLSNDKGEGDEARAIKQYVGKDTPGLCKNVALTRDDATGELVLTWEAPEAGTHGGYYNPAEVKYRVKRMPAGKEVSSDAQSPLREQLGEESPALCFYEVTAYVDENTVGLPATSNKIMAGKPFAVPYSEDFAKNDNVVSFTIEDSNNDGTSWEYQYDYGYMRLYSNDKVKNDWIITPFIALEKGVEYKLTFDVKSLGTETMEVKLGTEPASASMTQELMKEFTVTESDFTNKECTFIANDNKPYFIGFHSTTQNVDDGLAIYLDNIKLERVNASAVSTIAETATIALEGNALVSKAAIAQQVGVFTLDGRAIFNGTLAAGTGIVLNSGMYAVHTSGKSFKIVVR